VQVENGEFDAAVAGMMAHPETAFQEARFLECAAKVRNQENYYKACTFFIEFFPLRLNQLLAALSGKVDHSRVVGLLRRSDNLPLAMPYLKAAQQSENLKAVNEAYNEVLVEEEDFEALRESVDERDAFDQVALAQKLEKHELLEFRRIAAYIFKKNKRFAESVRISKADKVSGVVAVLGEKMGGGGCMVGVTMFGWVELR